MKDIEWVNKRKRPDGSRPPAEPLYGPAEVEACLDSFEAADYLRPFSVAGVAEVTLRDAGHILGSAGITLDITEGGQRYRIGFTGDIGRPNMALIRDPDILRDLDILIMESTYGNRLHGSNTDIEEELAQAIRGAAAAGGKIIIPAFAVGRTQHLVYVLHKLFDQNRIPDIPFFVDSPLARDATEIFRKYPQYFDDETKRIFFDKRETPFDFPRLNYTHSVDESKKLNDLKFPHVIISGSGMCEGGRVLHHLRNNIADPRTLCLFVGFAARETLARKLIDGWKRVRIFGEEHEVQCGIKVIDAFSAHADRNSLLDYLALNPPQHLKHLFLVHGEPEQSLAAHGCRTEQGV